MNNKNLRITNALNTPNVKLNFEHKPIILLKKINTKKIYGIFDKIIYQIISESSSMFKLINSWRKKPN